jgi:prepilin-type N-terminal cleavage/methylation domain-containing protein
VRNRTCAGFTLLELLVVIGIIAVLLGFIFPVFQGVQDRAKKVQAKNDLTQIVTAVNAFYTEYGRYPLVGNVTTPDTTYGSGSSGAFFDELRAKSSSINTRQIVFISPPEDTSQDNPKGKIGKTGEFCDPWSSAYSIRIDADYDNQVTNPYGTNGAGPDPIRQGVIAWSFGKNGLLGGGRAANKAKFTDEPGSAGNFTNSGDVISWQ